MSGKDKVFKALTPEADDLAFERVVNVALATLSIANALAVIVVRQCGPWLPRWLPR